MIQTHCISKRFNLAQNPPLAPKTVYDKGMKNELASFLLIPADPKLAGFGTLWLEYQTREAAEDVQAYYAERGFTYDLVPVLAAETALAAEAAETASYFPSWGAAMGEWA